MELFGEIGWRDADPRNFDFAVHDHTQLVSVLGVWSEVLEHGPSRKRNSFEVGGFQNLVGKLPKAAVKWRWKSPNFVLLRMPIDAHAIVGDGQRRQEDATGLKVRGKIRPLVEGVFEHIKWGAGNHQEPMHPLVVDHWQLWIWTKAEPTLQHAELDSLPGQLALALDQPANQS